MLRKLLPRRIRRTLGKLRDSTLSRLLAARARRRLERPQAGRPHHLPGELIVSLTSYPARFGTLHLTLACLLDQSVKADKTILWIAREDMDELPAEVRRLEAHGLEIRACDDLRSYKKLIPALEAFPDAFIATADDDVYYSGDWLEMLLEVAEDDVITCHRAHRITRFPDGSLRPYLEWEFDVQDAASRQQSSDIFPTGAGGTLYPRHSLDQRVTDRLLFERLAPDGDDLWLYWCARMAGTQHKKVGGQIRLTPWRGSQASTLWSKNEARNDRIIAALSAELGRVR